MRLLIFTLLLTVALVPGVWGWEANWGHIWDKYCTDADCALYYSFDNSSDTAKIKDHSPYGLDLTLPGAHLHDDDQEEPDVNSAAADNDWNTYKTELLGVNGIEQDYIIPGDGVEEINITWKFNLTTTYAVNLKVYNFSNNRWITVYTTTTPGLRTITVTINKKAYGITNTVKTRQTGTTIDNYEQKITYMHTTTKRTGLYGNSIIGDYAYNATNIGNIINANGFLEYTVLMIANITPVVGTQYLFGYYYYTGWGAWLPAVDFKLINNELVSEYWDTYESTGSTDVTNKISYGTVNGWVCAAITYRTATKAGDTYPEGVKAYLNGQLINKNTTQAHAIGNMNISLGRKIDLINDNTSFSVSMLDEVIVFRYILTQQEINNMCHQAWINIYAKDEDSNNNIENENITAYIYDTSTDLTVAKSTGAIPLRFTLTAPENMLITAYTNTTYSNQRRMLVTLPTPPGEQNVTIFLLKDGRGSINYFYVKSGGVSIPDASVLVKFNNIPIDYGLTDTNGLFISYLDPYKLYKINATARGYNSTEVSFYGTSLVVHEVILELKKLLGLENIKIKFYPEDEKISQDTSQFLWIEVTNWQLVDNITVLVADDPNWVKIYEEFGETEPGSSEVYFFDLNNTDTSWCNATILCLGDNTTVKWRVMPIPLNNFGDTGHVIAVAYVTDINGNVQKYGRTGWIVRAYNAIFDFLQRFSYEQRAFMGLLLIMMGTGIASARLNLTFYQSGYVAFILILVVTALGLWSPAMALAPAMAFIAVILYKEVLK